MITIESLVRTYHSGDIDVPALRGVSLEVAEGAFLALAGPSGSGKTTLLNCMGCIDRPDGGRLILDGQDVATLKPRALSEFRRRHLGFIFQSFNLIPVLTVYENIEFPLLLGKERLGKAEKKEWIEFLIKEVGLENHRNHRPNELSGGQRQRVAIARSLACKPKVVLADEPTANLDSVTGEKILELMKKVNKEMNTTFIFSTHDATIVSIADHVVRLKDGLVIEETRKDR